MKKIDLIKRLLEFTDTLDEEVVIRVVTRDGNGVIKGFCSAPIDSIGDLLYGPVINITDTKISKMEIIR